MFMFFEEGAFGLLCLDSFLVSARIPASTLEFICIGQRQFEIQTVVFGR